MNIDTNRDNYVINLKLVAPYLLDKSYNEVISGKIKPSEIHKELRCSTEERIEKLKNPKRRFKMVSRTDAFNRIPEAVIFQNFDRGQAYTFPVLITNQSKVSKNIKVFFDASRHFTVTIEDNVKSRIAPGMSINIKVTFRPTEKFRDYINVIRVTSRDESFQIPIFGLGPRPISTTPDKIILPHTMVRLPSEKALIVKNISEVPLQFVAVAESPFSIEIKTATVPPDGIFEEVIRCVSQKAGLIKRNMQYIFRNQISLTVELECEVKIVKLYIDTYSLDFDDVYMGLSTNQVLTLRNDSKYPLKFIWKQHDAEEENRQLKKMLKLYGNVKENEEMRCKKLEYLDIVNQEQHSDIYQRIYENECELLTSEIDTFSYRSPYFEIIPKIGKILPYSDFEFMAIFTPKEAKYYSCNAYLDIEGLENRIKVDLQGGGLGPKVTLNVASIDANQIYLTDKHQYEIDVTNEGIIAATVEFIEKPSSFGGSIHCLPRSLKLEPNDSKAFLIIFSSEVHGEFLETIDFRIVESGDTLQSLLSGKVICPLLKCIPNQLDWRLSVGLVHEKTFLLINDSKVAISFDISITGKNMKYRLEVDPSGGLVGPRSDILIKVTFCSERESEVTANILVTMWKSSKYVLNIPLRCICSCPKVVCSPTNIMIKFCFLNCRYRRVIAITNMTDLPGFIEYNSAANANHAIECQLEKSKLYLEARQCVKLTLTITVTQLGPHELPLSFLLGQNINQTLCTINCNGQGPVISYYPDEVNFGKVNVLKRYEKYLTLVNDSPISARVRIYCKNKTSFNIEDSTLELAAEETRKLAISVVFNDPGKIKDIILVEIYQGDVLSVKVSAEGIGTSIVCDPELSPELNLGMILTYKLFVQDVKVTNRGSYHNKLLFSKRTNVKILSEEGESSVPYIFKFEPCLFELDSGEEKEVTIKGICKHTKYVEEKFYCYSVSTLSKQISLIKEIAIVAEFVDPKVTFSRTDLHFSLNIMGSQQSGNISDIIHYQNETGLDLQVNVKVENSFSLEYSGEKSREIIHDLKNNSQNLAAIEYCPTIKEKRRYEQHGKLIFEYENHPKSDVINLHGEVMFPTIKLFPNLINFKCVPLGSTKYKIVVIKNISALMVSFKWYWSESLIEITHLEPQNTADHTKSHCQRAPVFSQSWFYTDNDILEYDEPLQNEEDAEEASVRIDDNNLTYDSKKYREEMRKILFPLLKVNGKNDFFDLPLKTFKSHDITKWLSIEPSEGVLEPAEYSLVTVGFNPPPNVELKVSAICKVYDGEEELLKICGKSSRLSYKLDKHIVDFGNKIFCETCVDQLKLTNNGLCNLSFKVLGDEFSTLDWDYFNVTPQNGLLEPNESVDLTVEYFPGIPGYFSKSFTLELGYLDPITVKVCGCAVLSQIFLHVPRNDMNLNDEDSYKAISWITPKYLEGIRTNTMECTDDINDPTDFLKTNDWVVIPQNELYPNLMDISMSMERIQAWKHVSANKKILNTHTFLKKVINVPDFVPSPYLVDFGYTVRDVPVCYTVTLYNYGPIKTDVKLMEDNKLSLVEHEFKIEFKDVVLFPGESAQLYVVYSPTLRKCPVLDTEVSDTLCIRVRHGPIITLQLKAVVTLPTVEVQHEVIQFNKVHCGSSLRKTVILSNNGNVASKWFLTLGPSQKKAYNTSFFIFPKEGELNPEGKSKLNIYFYPAQDGEYKQSFKIEVERNDAPIQVQLLGEGITPMLTITPMELEFSPTLSYFYETVNFCIENLSDVGLEFCFPTFNTEADTERRLIEIFLKRKSVNHVFIPYRKAGEKLPSLFTEVYNNLVDRLRKKMRQAKSLSDEDEGSEGEEETNISESVSNIQSNDDPLANYTPEKLFSLLKEFIEVDEFESELNESTLCNLEDYSNNIEIIEPQENLTDSQLERNLVLIITHGAKNTDYFKAANELGIDLSYPVYSIDKLIIEALIEQTEDCAKQVLNVIEEKYSELRTGLTASTESLLNKEDNAYYKILDKITVILTTKPKKQPKKPGAKDNASKASSDKSQAKNKSNISTDCFLNLPPDVLVDLLKLKLSKFNYIVIESLTSTFFSKENLALYSLLRAAGPVKYIHFIYFSYTIDDFVRNELAKQYVPEENKNDTDLIVVKKPVEEEKRSPEKKSGKKASEKGSKSSSKSKKESDLTKKILKTVTKSMKEDFEKCELLLREVHHVSQYWDRKTGTLRKPFVGKAQPSKKDTNTKESIKTLKNSNKRSSDVNMDDNDNVMDVGFHIWIMANSDANREKDFCNMLRSVIKTYEDLQKAIKYVKNSLEPVWTESETLFSVISNCLYKENTNSNVFTIRDFKVIGSSSLESTKSRSKSASIDIKSKRRKNSRRGSTSSKSTEPYILPLKDKDDMEFTTRAALEPGDIVKYEVVFSPQKPSKFKHKYNVYTVNNNVSYEINCSGTCELPDIDFTPEVMFSKVLEDYREKASYDHFVYIKNQQILDFGSVIVNPNAEKCQAYSCFIKLRNPRSTIAEVSVSFSNDLFFTDTSTVTVLPKCEEKLKIIIKPTKIGTVIASIYISVKNNPKICNFTLACTPCKLEFSVSPKSISFDKVPVNYTAKRTVKLVNSSPINLRWEFEEYEWANETLDFSETKGFLALYSTSDITFRFSPREEMVFSKKYLYVKVYDVNNENPEPFCVETILVHGDSVEYILEFKDLIDYGEVKGGIEHKYDFTIANKGKCEVNFQFQMIDNPLEANNHLRSFFKIQPQAVNLGSQKTEVIAVTVHPAINFSVKLFHLFAMNMVDNTQSGKLVKSYIIKTSISAFMPSFKICPHSHINFGNVQIMSTKRINLQLTNNGRFSFNYVIVHNAKDVEGKKKEPIKKKGGSSPKDTKSIGKDTSPISNKKEKTKSEKSKSSKDNKQSKKEKVKITKLDIRGFSVVSSSGTVEPDETTEISVDFMPRELEDYKEEILLNVAECSEKNKKKMLTLKGTGCEPKINFKEYDKIFIEQFIVKQYGDFVQTKNIENYCLFVESEMTLYFKLVCVNLTKSSVIYLKNIGFVDAIVTAKVYDDKNAFSVSPTTSRLEPCKSCSFEISYKPKSLQKAQGQLEISCNSLSNNKLTVAIMGEPCLPQITVLEPMLQHNRGTLNFDPTCVGYSTDNMVKLVNSGPIKCNVIMEVVDDNETFEMIPLESSKEYLNLQGEQYENQTKRILMFNLKPNDLAEARIIFKPVKEQSVDNKLNVHIVNNPYEIVKIELHASSYNSNVIMEKLKALKLETKDSSSSSLTTKSSTGYILDLGHQEMNRLFRTSFTIRNRSKQKTYKFRFFNSTLSFIPEVGHLKPGAWKEVLVVFKTTVPLSKIKAEIVCNICEIEYVAPDNQDLSWDDRQKYVQWLPESDLSNNSRDDSLCNENMEENRNKSASKLSCDSTSDVKGKVISEGIEPAIIVVPDSSEIIPIYFTVFADYNTYICDTKNIDFGSIYVKEKKMICFDVINTGKGLLNIEWTVIPKEEMIDVKRSSSSIALTQRSSGEARTLRSTSASVLSYESTTHYETFIAIDPMITAIESEASQSFDVSFNPDKPGKYGFILTSSISSLHPDLSNININVNAEALSIPFYIEYENGECLNKNLCMEFESIGSGRENIRKVYLYNTSNDEFSYIITPVENKQFAYFNCETPRGTVKKNKKVPLSFAFIPQLLGQFQEQFMLRIPEKNIAEDFLLNGVCREPKVYFTEDNVILKPTVPNVKSTRSVYLVNDEKFPITFRFNKKTIFGENQTDKIDIFPITGKLGAQNKVEIKLCFVTTNAATNKFHIKCCIEKMKSSLFLHVTTICKKVEPSVSYTKIKDEVINLQEQIDNVIDLGQINKGKTESVTFTISNTGETGLFFSWEYNCQSVAHLFNITMDNEKGFLKGCSKTKTVLKFRSIRLGKLNKFKILLKIMYGPTYVIYVNITCENPLYTFSFNEYDFGYCFPQKKHSKYYQTNLVFRNTDTKDIILESLFDNNEHMAIDFNTATAHPGESLNIQIDFYPPKEGFYETKIPFQLSDIRHSVTVSGQCVPIKLSLVNAKDKFVDFEEVLLGSTKKHRLYFCNDTPSKMHVYFDFYDKLKFHEKKIEQLSNTQLKLPVIPPPPVKDTKTKKSENKKKSDDKPKQDKDSKESKEKKNKKERAKNDSALELELLKKSEALLKQKEEERKEFLSCFSITPNNFTIAPHGKARMEISFTALKKMKFQEEIYFEIQDHHEPFCIIKGSTISTECILSEKEVVFSGIVSGNCASRTIKLNNVGDVPESYSWVLEDKGNLFSIEPKQGFVLPKNDAVFKICFKPLKEICEYRAKAQCLIKEHKDPLILLLKGTSVKIPQPLNTITFTCNVRSETVQTININNNSFDSWDIKLDTSNDVFSAIREVVALPQKDTPVEIKYAPKTMTTSEPHKGDIFIKLPDGSIQLYKLIGNSLPPLAEKVIEKEISCKIPCFEFLPLENWLNTKQTFNVTTEVLSVVTPKTLYQISGTKSIQLDAKELKTYKWGITLINEGPIQLRVTFTNPETKEYVYYDLNLKALPCQPLKTFSFRTKIRSSETQQLLLENIIDVPITYSMECSEKSLYFEKVKKLEPYTSVKIDLIYKPTLVEEKEIILTAYCEELGTYLYNVKLKSDTAELMDTISIKAELGESNSRTILFNNIFDQLLEFSVKIDNAEFYITRCPPILPGQSEKIIICFEPSHIGIQESILYLSSPISGEYTYKLMGEGIIPTPRGPFVIKYNYPTIIEFKNPFYEDKIFNYQIQPDLFSVDLNQETVKAKKSSKIYVKINIKEKPLQNTITGKLIIYCSEHPSVYWSYYLQFDDTSL
ncbi:hypothetical protein GWI33_002530 [Rhynchophorus ferrugineus]|uniref:Hydrocephalus-inducing protein-like protein n=1 Tax=Rhynchophorus ferrugineus TaxID=354439 RepID=A0A834MPD1_RHYFE|nr:hypothetical protein GWI33_002530 [Rhynchophorus ferrugineus]